MFTAVLIALHLYIHPYRKRLANLFEAVCLLGLSFVAAQLISGDVGAVELSSTAQITITVVVVLVCLLFLACELVTRCTFYRREQHQQRDSEADQHLADAHEPLLSMQLEQSTTADFRALRDRARASRPE